MVPVRDAVGVVLYWRHANHSGEALRMNIRGIGGGCHIALQLAENDYRVALFERFSGR